MARMSDAEPPPDTRSVEELQRVKLLLEIEKLRADILKQNHDMRHDWLKLLVAAIAGTAALYGSAFALFSLLLK